MGVAVYIVVALISLVSTYLLTKTFRNDLEEQAPGKAVAGSPAGQRS